MLIFQAQAEQRLYGSEILKKKKARVRLAYNGFGLYGTCKLPGSFMLLGHNIDPLIADATICHQWWSKLDRPGMGSTYQ